MVIVKGEQVREERSGVREQEEGRERMKNSASLLSMDRKDGKETKVQQEQQSPENSKVE
jgi:hypothetical protein